MAAMRTCRMLIRLAEFCVCSIVSKQWFKVVWQWLHCGHAIPREA